MAKILIVEDDPFLRNIYEKVLLKEKFEVSTAEDGKQALARASQSQPDLIILDILMPVMDGIEFLREYDIKNKHPETKVIVFSNITMQSKVEEATALGAIGYKNKALFSPKEMVTVIKSTLGIS